MNGETGNSLATVLVIGGSDSAGMAGIQMDLSVIRALGGHGASVITATTAQNSGEFISINPVPAATMADQLAACRTLAPRVVKIGLLAGVEQVRLCADLLRETGLPAVLDPVLASSTGAAFADRETRVAMRLELMPLCTLVTPNRRELEQLTALALDEPADVEAAARALQRAGVPALLVKGGHWPGPQSADYALLPQQRFWLRNKRLDTAHARGTGCALASAVAAALAMGHRLDDALVIGKMTVNQGLRQGYGIAGQPGPLRITGFPEAPEDLPELTGDPVAPVRPAFPDCGPQPLGLYPVVDRAEWLARLLPQGITTIQLRIKDLEGAALAAEVERGIELARRHGARLFVNDHWRLAIEKGAYGVHLGHGDLDSADIDAIHRAGLRLGISTHCHREVARAHACRPSYMACGPVFATTTKVMPWTPHGVGGLGYWRRALADYPLVAIGGINRERLLPVAATGASGIAMITAITEAADPESMTRTFGIILGRAADG
jgi:hydroxymethylpyrimidine kinase/phosphomethylpyrimidine kinase/thiamine-phosphate diphosphorylase